MAVPHFIRFYQGYTIESVMDEFAVTFFSLINAMMRIKAEESLVNIQNISVPHMEQSEVHNTIQRLKQDSNGLDDYIEQAKIIRQAKKDRQNVN